MKTVALLAGHSTTDLGAVNPRTGHTEYGYNSFLVDLIADELARVGYVKPIIVHRESYSALPAKVNSTGADMAFEFHCNAFNGKASGTEMLYWHSSAKGRVMAEELQQAALCALALPDRGVKAIDSKARGGHLLRGTKMPCVIVESFFIDNDKDLRVGLDRQLQLAQAYAGAIEALCDE